MHQENGRAVHLLQSIQLAAEGILRHFGVVGGCAMRTALMRHTHLGGVKSVIPSLALFLLMLPTGLSARIQLGSDIDGEAAGDSSGYSVAVSSDGSNVAVGAPFNDGAGDLSGHVRVFRWNEVTWVQRGPDIDGEAAHDASGLSVALSSTGSLIAIGAPYNDGNGVDSGHVRVFIWHPLSSTWAPFGDDIDGEAAGDRSGTSVSLSEDGSLLAVGALNNDANGVESGQVRVFIWHPLSSTWVQRGPDIDGEAAGDRSGSSVALSSNGHLLAIGAPYNDANGVDSGQVRVFIWHPLTSTWAPFGDDIDGEAAGDRSGQSVALSSDGSYLAVGAPHNDGAAGDSGHVRVFWWNGSSWVQRGPDIDGEAVNDEAGTSVALSSNGHLLAIGAPGNDGNGYNSGQVRVFIWHPLTSTWAPFGSDIDGEAPDDWSGQSVALSSDGSYLAVGAPGNSGNGFESGHVRVFTQGLFTDGFESGTTSAWSAVVP